MNKAGIPNQKAFGPADIEKSAQYAARHDIATWTDSVYGEMKGIGITNKFKKNPAQIVASAPTFGEHSREVLEFLGYTEAQIDDMYAKGVTATMDPRETAHPVAPQGLAVLLERRPGRKAGSVNASYNHITINQNGGSKYG